SAPAARPAVPGTSGTPAYSAPRRTASGIRRRPWSWSGAAHAPPARSPVRTSPKLPCSPPLLSYLPLSPPLFVWPTPSVSSSYRTLLERPPATISSKMARHPPNSPSEHLHRVPHRTHHSCALVTGSVRKNLPRSGGSVTVCPDDPDRLWKSPSSNPHWSNPRTNSTASRQPSAVSRRTR